MAKEISLATVKEHNKSDDLWIVIENKVYDVTKFRSEHPGGEDTLDDVAGRDGTKEFIEVGHSLEAREILKKFYIGDLAAADIKKKSPVRCAHVGLALGAIILGFALIYVIKRGGGPKQ
ncbi:probable cytochrome b5 isoform X1 [Drosophila guanche]|uniref:Cytochrome b5 n=1 Tax=Drosophila guanche TaxID=7266 RepID=A0A3B0JX80_DROGU|nr:probable cytochrome b5 isoform X1 [Drosophila guanche]XP_034671916.1 probable cytochrome b5 isoform X1 [Drosophila subobscura]SPP86664.1 blast:Probable cytochrome b5 [Drosophila guanche]